MHLKIFLLSTVILATFGCGGSTEPAGERVLTILDLTGGYYSSQFNTEKSGVVTDQLRRGGSIDIWLYANGTTDGTLVMRADTAGGVDLDERLLGTWTLDGDVVTLSHPNNTFLEHIDFVFVDTYMAGETTLDEVTYRVGLAR